MPLTKRRRRPLRKVHCVNVFVSYAHRDERLRDELDKHLSSLRRSAAIASWHDRRICPGDDLDCEVDLHLSSAEVVLLLISPDFINSDYCYRREMRAALKRHANGLTRVIPIILRPVDWAATPIGKLLALPRDGKPVTIWHRHDEAFLDVARGVRRAVEEVSKHSRRVSKARMRGAVSRKLAKTGREND